MLSAKRFTYIVMLVFTTLVSLPLLAQEQAPSEDQTTYEELKVSLAEPLVIVPNEPSAVRAKFLEVVENKDGNLSNRTIVGLEDIDIEGVLSAEAQSQVRNDGTLSKRDLERLGGNITWNAVSLKKVVDEADSETKRALLPSPLYSNVDTEQSEVSAGSQVSAVGDVNGAIQVAKNLLEEDVPEEQPQEQEEEKTEEVANAATPSPGGGSSGGGEEGGQLGQTKSYDIEKQDEEPAPVISVTTEGCSVEPDIPNEVMIEMSQIVTDGSPSGNCQPSGKTFKLTKSYATCADEPVEAEGKVYARFRYSYVNAKGEQVYLDDENACRRDTDNVFDLVEDETACPNWREDLTEMKAYPQAKTIYYNRNNTLQVHKDCHDVAEKEPVEITENFDLCGIKDYFAEGYSAQLSRFTYDKNGTITQALPCAENGTTYEHVTVRNVCPAIEDYRADKMDYIEQIRKKIVTPSGELYVTLCYPDPERSFNIVSTTTGCENQFKHDILGSKSIGTKKYQYQDNNGNLHDLKDGVCVDDTTREYDHQFRITGYEHKDAEKKSYPETETYINTEFGKVVVQTPRVKDDAVGIPYTYLRTADLPAGVFYDDDGETLGCNKYTEMAETEVWSNADGDEVQYTVGSGTPTGPSNACEVTTCKLAEDWTNSYSIQSNISYAHWGTFNQQGEGYYANGYINSSCDAVLQREDGNVVSTTKLTFSASNSAPRTCTSVDPERGRCTNYRYTLSKPSAPSGSIIQNIFNAHGLPY